MEKIIPLIPAYNSTPILIEYVQKLHDVGFNKIIIIDDGSKNKKIFNDIKKLEYCLVFTHQIHLGKGAAIKTGFRYFIRNLSNEYVGMITIDDDFQLSIKDVLKLVNFYDKDSLLLGIRNFNSKNVPFKSKMGNKITSFMFKLVYKKKLNDTQTGLRIYPTSLIKNLCYLDGNNFDFETNVLIYCISKNVNITEITIDTIYLNKNPKLKPFKDSVKIFLKSRKKYK